MTAVPAKRNYKATFILDTRGREESVEQLVEDLKKEIISTAIDVLRVENLGRRDFARVPDPKMTAGNYVQFDIAGPAETVLKLNEHFRLNPVVFRVIVQSV